MGAAVGALAAYGMTRAPRIQGWGATAEELSSRMPGDEIVGNDPLYRTTRAVTVETGAEEVWPWLVQLGQGRGGLYSYDWLENLVGLDIHSADRVVPELQDLAVGDEVRLTPPGTRPELAFVVATLEAPSVLVLGPSGPREEALAQGLPYPAWTFALRPDGPGRCRLVVRFQLDAPATWPNRLAYGYALRPVHLVMERRMLLGIRQRAEGRLRRSAPPRPRSRAGRTRRTPAG
jgi:hypothetical protein